MLLGLFRFLSVPSKLAAHGSFFFGRTRTEGRERRIMETRFFFLIFSRFRTTPPILIQIKVEKLRSFGHLSNHLRNTSLLWKTPGIL